jgi:hypothetical protein
MVKTARTNPAVFFATCARLIPNDVRVTVQQQLPGNLSAEDWAMMREIVEAVKQALLVLLVHRRVMFSSMCWPSFETETVARIPKYEQFYLLRPNLTGPWDSLQC